MTELDDLFELEEPEYETDDEDVYGSVNGMEGDWIQKMRSFGYRNRTPEDDAAFRQMGVPVSEGDRWFKPGELKLSKVVSETWRTTTQGPQKCITAGVHEEYPTEVCIDSPFPGLDDLLTFSQKPLGAPGADLLIFKAATAAMAPPEIVKHKNSDPQVSSLEWSLIKSGILQAKKEGVVVVNPSKGTITRMKNLSNVIFTVTRDYDREYGEDVQARAREEGVKIKRYDFLEHEMRLHYYGFSGHKMRMDVDSIGFEFNPLSIENKRKNVVTSISEFSVDGNLEGYNVVYQRGVYQDSFKYLLRPKYYRVNGTDMQSYFKKINSEGASCITDRYLLIVSNPFFGLPIIPLKQQDDAREEVVPIGLRGAYIPDEEREEELFFSKMVRDDNGKQIESLTSKKVIVQYKQGYVVDLKIPFSYISRLSLMGKLYVKPEVLKNEEFVRRVFFWQKKIFESLGVPIEILILICQKMMMLGPHAVLPRHNLLSLRPQGFFDVFESPVGRLRVKTRKKIIKIKRRGFVRLFDANGRQTFDISNFRSYEVTVGNRVLRFFKKRKVQKLSDLTLFRSEMNGIVMFQFRTLLANESWVFGSAGSLWVSDSPIPLSPYVKMGDEYVSYIHPLKTRFPQAFDTNFSLLEW